VSDQPAQDGGQSQEEWHMAIKAVVFDVYGTLCDIRSVEPLIDIEFPGQGEFIAGIWRMKQLEYTWLRSMMGRYENFWTITRDALTFTLTSLGLETDTESFNRIVEKYNDLDLYPDTKPALRSLSQFQLAILSNGSSIMLQMLSKNTGLDYLIGQTISVDSEQVFKPDPRTYSLVEKRLGLSPHEVLFVSSNGFDISGAKSYGFNTVRIDRVTEEKSHPTSTDTKFLEPSKMFAILRARVENIGFGPDYVVNLLTDLPEIVSAGVAEQ